MVAFLNQSPGVAVLLAAGLLLAVLLIVLALLRRREGRERAAMEERLLNAQAQMLDRLRQAMFESARAAREGQEQGMTLLNQSVAAASQQVAELSRAMEARQDRLRQTLDERLDAMTALNDRKLEQMRQTVSEKLESTLENRLGESFKLVNEQLSRVHKGLGEMQTLAQGVGDLKKVLTGVKTRGVWGEVRLRALLEDALSPGQYVENAQVTPGSAERVEFAIRLPAADGEGALLPVDSKFPQEDYLRLVDASRAGDTEGVRAARKQLESAVREQAKRIRDKYIKPPATTDYAVLFLPVESLYAEVARIDGLLEALQAAYRVLVAGPSTFAALLTSLQMGFRTVALQKRSGEVLALLVSVKAEFQKYGEAVQKARTRLEQASGDLDFIDTRARALSRKLRDVGEDAPAMPDEDAN